MHVCILCSVKHWYIVTPCVNEVNYMYILSQIFLQAFIIMCLVSEYIICQCTVQDQNDVVIIQIR